MLMHLSWIISHKDTVDGMTKYSNFMNPTFEY